MLHSIRLFAILLAAALALAGCREKEQAAAPEPIRPVKTFVIPAPESGGIRRFPARIESTRRAEVSFRVAGKIIELPIKEGERVKKGELVAKLDPTDYQLVVDDKEAVRFRAQRDYDRAKPLADKGFVTKKELDRREANLKSADAVLKQVKQDLAYTTLAAPFDGQISKRLVQKFEEIQAKQAIVELRDLEALEVKFDVPEQIMLRVRGTERQEGKEEGTARPDIHATFDAAPGKKFALDFREIATTADPATRTFEATYTMETPEKLTVLPGMTANVTVDLSDFLDATEVTYVPVEAVTAKNDLSGEVWIVDEKTMTVSPRSVKVGQLRANSIAVADGLKPNDRIVVAGVPFLVAGMKVRLMAMPEQAVEREDDAKVRRAAEKRLEQSKKQAN